MHLLLVEDNPTDRMVIQARLRRAFPSAQIMAADDPNGLNEHLKRDRCDIVITDYWTDGRGAGSSCSPATAAKR